MSPELLLTLDRRSAAPLRAQLETQLREAIRSGRLRTGERLPSSRELARALSLSRGLIQECYGQLLAEGYLSARGGSATRVAAGAAAPPAANRRPGAAGAARAAAPARLLADFITGVPDLASFPRDDWLWAMREACRAAPSADFNYGDPRGSPVLREVLAAYLRRVRGAAADAGHMVICTGFGQGLGLVLRVLARHGVRRVAFEDPGYGDSAEAAAWAGAEAVPVPVGESGIDVAALAATGARAVVLTPAHQWPTGVVLAAERRQALVSWASEHDATIIEDDYDAEFRYDRDPVGALQGLAADRVAALGTVSKSLSPSVRLGWILCPPALAHAIAEEKRLTDRGSPWLDQLALATLVESGRYDRQLRRMRAVYSRRRDTLAEAAAAHLPGVRLTGLAAGFHVVAHLPADMARDEGAEHALIAAARARSVGLYGMSQYRSTRAAVPGQLVLGFGNLNERAIRAGLAVAGEVLREAGTTVRLVKILILEDQRGELWTAAGWRPSATACSPSPSRCSRSASRSTGPGTGRRSPTSSRTDGRLSSRT
ncbi:MAG: PLP-dependent aminotransferase family protein [Streptosporangiaceae bacterium]|nr:PLP-dependent aminotransferase family protein [Streptosporangiaceae bacterium]